MFSHLLINARSNAAFIKKLFKLENIVFVILSRRQNVPKALKFSKQTFKQEQPFLFTAIATTVFCATKSASSSKMEATNSIADLIQNADQLFDENLYQEALDVLNSTDDQSICDIKWRQARIMYKLSQIDKKNKKTIINTGFELAEEAIRLNDKDFSAHKWMAILLDAKSSLIGIKARISQLTAVKNHIVTAVELNPNDATSWYMLGSLVFLLADMPWYEKKIVAALFGSPPISTYEEALEHFLRAEKTKPNFYSMNLLHIGKCYQRLNDHEKAKHYLTLAANVKVLNEDDKLCKDEATTLLKKF